VTSGVARLWCQGARRSRRRRCKHRRAKGAEWGRVWGGVSHPQPTRWSGGASWAPPAGSGAEPQRLSAIGFSACFRPQNASGSKKNKILLHKLQSIRKNWLWNLELLKKLQIPLLKSGGDRHHRHIQSCTYDEWLKVKIIIRYQQMQLRSQAMPPCQK